MKKQIKKMKTLTLDKETLSRLNVAGGVYQQEIAASGWACPVFEVCD